MELNLLKWYLPNKVYQYIKSNMKLYTKEMFLEAAEKCEVSMIDARHIMKYIDEYAQPIQLPSDEEIAIKSIDYTEKRYSYKGTFQKGAKWMKDSIISQK